MKSILKGIWVFCSYLFWPQGNDYGKLSRKNKAVHGERSKVSLDGFRVCYA